MGKKYGGGDSPSTAPKSDNDWRAESDLRTLMEAQKIKSDKGRFRAALAKRDEMREQLGGIRGWKT